MRKLILFVLFSLVSAKIQAENSAVMTNSSGKVTAPSTFLSQNILSPSGKVTFVDSVNGSNSTGTRANAGLPFLTLDAAVTAASSGDAIQAGPGSYTVTNSIAKNGVNWNLSGSITSTSSGVGIFDDSSVGSNGAVVSNINVLDLINTAGSLAQTGGMCINVTNASSVVTAHARDISFFLSATPNSPLFCSGGALDVTARSVFGSIPLWWEDGDMHTHASLVNSTDTQGQAIYANAINDAPTGQFWTTADSVLSSNAGLLTTGDTLQQSSSPTAEVYLTAQRISCPQDPVFIDGCKVYLLNCGKIELTSNNTSSNNSQPSACIGIDAGQGWIEAQKFRGLILNQTGGEIHIQSMSWLDNLTGTNPAFATSAGSAYIEGGYYKAVTSNGVNISGGSMRLHNVTLDFSAVAAGHPVTISGGTLILDHCTLIAHSGQASIYATGAENVTCINCSANTAVDSHVTVLGSGLTIDANVQ